ncbi:hypothetical protein [Tardiphaga sp. P5_C10]
MNMMVSASLVGTAIPSQTRRASAAEADPIFAAIEAHKVAHSAVYRACEIYNDLDVRLPAEVCKSSITEWERKIVKTDAPEWIAATIGQHSAHEAESAAALDLINVVPTTTQGVAALLQYVVEVEKRIGEWWPRDDFEDGDIVGRNGKPRSFNWYHFVCRNALAGLAGGGARS